MSGYEELYSAGTVSSATLLSGIRNDFFEVTPPWYLIFYELNLFFLLMAIVHRV